MSIKNYTISKHSDQNLAKEQSASTGALVTAFSSGISGMGDAFLYIYLPIYGYDIGLEVFAIGFILSVNRFSRLFSNKLIAWISKYLGLRMMVYLAVVSAVITTFSYGLAPPFYVWMIARVLWGMSYSIFRLSTIKYSQTSSVPSKTLGISKSIKEIGPLLIYGLGPFLMYNYGAEILFTILSILPILLLPFLGNIPKGRYINQNIKLFNIVTPTFFDLWSFISAFIDAAVVVGLSVLIKFTGNEVINLLSSTALYIAFRKVTYIFLSPSTGYWNQKFGMRNVFICTGSILILGVGLIILKLGEIGVIIIFISLSINTIILPLILLKHVNPREEFETLSRIHSYRDLGASMGALIILPWITAMNITLVFIILGIASLSIFIFILNSLFKKPIV